MGIPQTPLPTSLAPNPSVFSPGISSPNLNQTINPTLSPSMSSAPTVQSWMVGSADLFGVTDADGALDARIRLFHSVGYSVKQNHTVIELYDFNCNNKMNNTGSTVYLLGHGGNIGYGTILSYDLGIDQTLLGDSEDSFVTLITDPANNEVSGQAACCTRVSSYKSDTEDEWTAAFFRETNFVLNFKIEDNNLVLGDISVTDYIPEVVDVDSGLPVN